MGAKNMKAILKKTVIKKTEKQIERERSIIIKDIK